MESEVVYKALVGGHLTLVKACREVLRQIKLKRELYE